MGTSVLINAGWYYPSCTGQVRNAVFSLTAGRNAVNNAN